MNIKWSPDCWRVNIGRNKTCQNDSCDLETSWRPICTAFCQENILWLTTFSQKWKQMIRTPRLQSQSHYNISRRRKAGNLETKTGLALIHSRAQTSRQPLNLCHRIISKNFPDCWFTKAVAQWRKVKVNIHWKFVIFCLRAEVRKGRMRTSLHLHQKHLCPRATFWRKSLFSETCSPLQRDLTSLYLPPLHTSPFLPLPPLHSSPFFSLNVAIRSPELTRTWFNTPLHYTSASLLLCSSGW